MGDGEPTDELADDVWRLPSVNGEAEADALVGVEDIGTVALELVGDEEQAFVGGCGQLLGSPAGVARAREIENHGAKI